MYQWVACQELGNSQRLLGAFGGGGRGSIGSGQTGIELVQLDVGVDGMVYEWVGISMRVSGWERTGTMQGSRRADVYVRFELC